MNIRYMMTNLFVADQQRSRDFYARVLEREPILDVPGMTEFSTGEGVYLGLMPETGIARLLPALQHPPTQAPGIAKCELYLKVDKPEDALQRAIEAGATLVSEYQVRGWGDVAGYCTDPDGHIIAFALSTT